MEAKQVVPMRVVPPPEIGGRPWEMAEGKTAREEILEPLSMRERALVCAVADTLSAFKVRAEYEGEPSSGGLYALEYAEKNALLGLLVTFEDATGCKFSEARW